jgi:hypothetical protein
MPNAVPHVLPEKETSKIMAPVLAVVLAEDDVHFQD